MRPSLVSNHPRQRKDVDRCGTGAQQDLGAGGQRGTGGQHVVDQDDATTGDAVAMSPGHLERRGRNVLQTGLLAQPLL
jgi:hypothetical protein